jgi:hypothetical protein
MPTPINISINKYSDPAWKLEASGDGLNLESIVNTSKEINALGSNSIVTIYNSSPDECTSTPCIDDDNCNSCAAKIVTELKASLTTLAATSVTLGSISQKNIPSFSKNGYPTKLLLLIDNYLGQKTLCDPAKYNSDIEDMASQIISNTQTTIGEIRLFTTDTLSTSNFPPDSFEKNVDIDTINLYPEKSTNSKVNGPLYNLIDDGATNYIMSGTDIVITGGGVPAYLTRIDDENSQPNSDNPDPVATTQEPIIVFSDSSPPLNDHIAAIPENGLKYNYKHGVKKMTLPTARITYQNQVIFNIKTNPDLLTNMHKYRHVTVQIENGSTVNNLNIDVHFKSSSPNDAPGNLTSYGKWFLGGVTKPYVSVFLLGEFYRIGVPTKKLNYCSAQMIHDGATNFFEPLATSNFQFKLTDTNWTDFGIDKSTVKITHVVGLYQGSVIITCDSIESGKPIVLYKTNSFSNNQHSEFFDLNREYTFYYQNYDPVAKSGSWWSLRKKALTTPPISKTGQNPVYSTTELFRSSRGLSPFTPYDPWDFVTGAQEVGITWNAVDPSMTSPLKVICPVGCDSDVFPK